MTDPTGRFGAAAAPGAVAGAAGEFLGIAVSAALAYWVYEELTKPRERIGFNERRYCWFEGAYTDLFGCSDEAPKVVCVYSCTDGTKAELVVKTAGDCPGSISE